MRSSPSLINSLVNFKSKRYAFTSAGGPGSFRAGAGRGTSYPTLWSGGARNPIRHEPLDCLAVNWSQAAFDVKCEIWKRFPKSPAVSAAIRSDAWLSRWGVTRLGSLQSTPTYEDFVVPSEWDALSSWFRDHSFEIRMGQSGRYGEAAITSLGGLDSLNELASRQFL
jgi:hypothetical protein